MAEYGKNDKADDCAQLKNPHFMKWYRQKITSYIKFDKINPSIFEYIKYVCNC